MEIIKVESMDCVVPLKSEFDQMINEPVSQGFNQPVNHGALSMKMMENNHSELHSSATAMNSYDTKGNFLSFCFKVLGERIHSFEVSVFSGSYSLLFKPGELSIIYFIN